MASNEVSMMDSVLPVALANASLLIAAPGLGCLTTYTIALDDLCRTYKIPSPNLTQVIQYKISTTASSSTKSVNSCNSSMETQLTRNTVVPAIRIKEEYAEPISDPIKQEIEQYTEMYWACRKLPQTNQDDPNRSENRSANLSCLEYMSSVQKDSIRPAIQSANQNESKWLEDQQANHNDTKGPKVQPANHNDATMSETNQNDQDRFENLPVNLNGSLGPECNSSDQQVSHVIQPTNENKAARYDGNPGNLNDIASSGVLLTNQKYAESYEDHSANQNDTGISEVLLVNQNDAEMSMVRHGSENDKVSSEVQSAYQDNIETFKIQRANQNDAEMTQVQLTNQNGAESSKVQAANQNEVVRCKFQSASQIDTIGCDCEILPATQIFPGSSDIQTASSEIPLEQHSNKKGTSTENQSDLRPINIESFKAQLYNKMITQVSYLLPNGNRRQEAGAYVHLHFEIMPVKYLQDNNKPKDAVMSVLRVEEGSTSLPYLVISIKEEPSLIVRFKDICLVSLWRHDCIIIQHYTSDGQNRTLHIQSLSSKTSSGKIRNASENNVALFNWLHTFLG